MLISQALAPVALKNPGRIAFRYLDMAITYKDFWQTTNRMSYYLQKEIGHGLRVGLWMSNSPTFAQVLIALANTKSCAVPLDPSATPDENLFKIKHSEVTVVLCTSDYVKAVKEMLQQAGLGAVNVLDMENKRCAEYDPTFTPSTSHPLNERDEILLFYTPGTTGKYKGCLFNHNAIVQAMTAVKNAYKSNLSDVFYTQGHFSHPFDFIHFLFAPLLVGATVYISDRKEFRDVLSGMVEARVTRMAPNTVTLPELLKFSEAEKMPIVPVKQFVIQNYTLPKTVFDILKKNTKITIMSVYGTTEYLGTIAMSTPEIMNDGSKIGFVGPALLGTKIRVLDDNNDEIDKKQPQKGQIVVSGPCLMSKYLNLPEDQKMTVRGTWLFTGDSVEIDANGNVIFQDRVADIVKLVDGRKVFAKDIEPHIRRIPDIEECAYLGIRDPMKKFVPAVVAIRKAASKVTEKQLLEYLATKIVKDKLPLRIFFVDALPRTVSGAINRAKLRAQFDGMG